MANICRCILMWIFCNSWYFACLKWIYSRNAPHCIYWRVYTEETQLTRMCEIVASDMDFFRISGDKLSRHCVWAYISAKIVSAWILFDKLHCPVHLYGNAIISALSLMKMCSYKTWLFPIKSSKTRRFSDWKLFVNNIRTIFTQFQATLFAKNILFWDLKSKFVWKIMKFCIQTLFVGTSTIEYHFLTMK